MGAIPPKPNERNGKKVMTRNGIEYNLSISPYTVEKNGLTFYFSSKRNLKTFEDTLTDFIYLECEKLSKKYKLKISAYAYGSLVNILSVVLYKRIEKRGFLVLNTDIEGSNEPTNVDQDTIWYL